MRFQQDFIEKVQEANNLVDIISQYTQLKPASGGFMGRCPFPDHTDKGPSFSVSESKQVYNCFGCGKKGNMFTFLREYNGMSFREAVEFLAARAHLPLPEPAEADRGEAERANLRKRELMAVNRLAAQFYFEQYRRLPAQHHAREYVKKRGLSPEILQTFQIGYAPEEWDSLTQFLRNKGVNLALAEEARLIKARKEGNGYFDIFRDRLMFPICNLTGEPIAFGGRVILQGEPKYLNSPESPVFSKGKTLYGLSQTARYIRSEDQALVVEGYMDLVSLYQMGLHQVVATMGTALTPDHGRMLGRMTKNVVALFDGDAAGLAAAERSLPILLSADLHPKGLVLPDEMDPDDYVRSQGSESLKALLDRAPDLFTMVFNQWTREFRGEASEKVQLCDRLSPLFESMRDQRLKALYFKEVQKKLNVDERWLLGALRFQTTNSTMAAGPAKISPPAVRETAPPRSVESHQAIESQIEGVIQLKGAPQVEILLFGLMLKNRAYFGEVEKTLESHQIFSHAGLKMLLQKAAELSRQGPEKFDKLTGLLSSFVDKPELLIGAGEPAHGRSEMIDERELQETERSLFRDCLRKARDLSLKSEVEQIQIQLKSSPAPELMQRLMEIQRERLALKKES